MDTIVLATNNTQTRQTVDHILGADSQILMASTPNQLCKHLKNRACDCLFIDLAAMNWVPVGKDTPSSPQERLEWIRQMRPMMGIVIIVARPDIRQAVTYLKHGASSYITEPVDTEEMRLVLDEIARERQQESELAYLRERVLEEGFTGKVRTNSPLMQQVYKNINSVAPTKATVLLLGDTGTGKSHTARLIHRSSNRKDEPFISVHCGAIPDTLIESELFGYEKGAFTGAYRRKPGKFELASGGTIFLDEIGTISPAAQVKLLNILQEGTFQRVGGEADLTANVRVIAASNADLKQMCDAGQFRKDLYYRLNVFPITIPQLHERREDIPLFVERFIARFNKFNAKEVRGVEPFVMDALMHYEWPGNLRELENLLERAHILEMGELLSQEGFPAELFEGLESKAEIAIDTKETLAVVRSKALVETERRYLKQLLVRNRGKINATAAEAGITTRQLNKLMHKHNLDKRAFKIPA